ncbi:MAG: hypothetical protein ABIO57_01895 [Candidatus Paceibacterota bacterium]
MKRTLLLAMVVMTTLLSCKKETIINPAITPSITISVKDIVYHPHGAISITWKTAGMPEGSSVTAEMYTTYGGYIPLVPQTIYGPPDGDGTADDGAETFTLPGFDNQNTGGYTQFGKVFQIYVIVQYQDQSQTKSSTSYMYASQYSQLINIQP